MQIKSSRFEDDINNKQLQKNLHKHWDTLDGMFLLFSEYLWKT